MSIMKLSIEQQLKAPFPVKQIKWRVGSTSKDKSKGIALAYIDSRDVMKRLDEVLGIEGWFDKYTYEEPRYVRKSKTDWDTKKTEYWMEQICGRVTCHLSCQLTPEGFLTKCDGAGETNVEGEKGGISDAFKRAAVKWGIGRYLYYLPNKWVPLDQYKKLAETPQMPPWATPEGYMESLVKAATK